MCGWQRKKRIFIENVSCTAADVAASLQLIRSHTSTFHVLINLTQTTLSKITFVQTHNAMSNAVQCATTVIVIQQHTAGHLIIHTGQAVNGQQMAINNCSSVNNANDNLLR